MQSLIWGDQGKLSLIDYDGKAGGKGKQLNFVCNWSQGVNVDEMREIINRLWKSAKQQQSKEEEVAMKSGLSKSKSAASLKEDPLDLVLSKRDLSMLLGGAKQASPIPGTPPQVLRVMEAGEMFGEISFLAGGLASASVVVHEKTVEVYAIEAEFVRSLFGATSIPDFPIFDGRYEAISRLGSGSFGRVYEGIDRETGASVAIKIEDMKKHANGPSLLQREAAAYTSVKTKFRDGYCVPGTEKSKQMVGNVLEGVYIPRMLWYGLEEGHKAMVMDLLGPSLGDVLNLCNRGVYKHLRRFSLGATLTIAVQCIRILEALHSVGILHRDIKPANFLMNNAVWKNQIHVVDFGLSKEYINHETGKHIPMVQGKGFTVGTPQFASLNANRGLSVSRRDDLEAVGYMLVYFVSGLPWAPKTSAKKATGVTGQRAREITFNLMHSQKLQTSTEDLCKDLPSCFRQYFEHVKNLTFTEKPDYNKCVDLFLDEMKNLGIWDAREIAGTDESLKPKLSPRMAALAKDSSDPLLIAPVRNQRSKSDLADKVHVVAAVLESGSVESSLKQSSDGCGSPSAVRNKGFVGGIRRASYGGGFVRGVSRSGGLLGLSPQVKGGNVQVSTSHSGSTEIEGDSGRPQSVDDNPISYPIFSTKSVFDPSSIVCDWNTLLPSSSNRAGGAVAASPSAQSPVLPLDDNMKRLKDLEGIESSSLGAMCQSVAKY